MPMRPRFTAPATSHLESWRAFVPSEQESGDPYIEVTFRAKGRWPRATYRYAMPDEDICYEMIRQLVSADQPGKIVHALLERYPYRRA